MSKHLTSNQVLGEIGETAARLRFLQIGFQFDTRSRLEAGIDAIAEVMDQGRPLARMIAVQVKAKDSGKYASEDDTGFTYLLRAEDVEYWRPSNLPVIIVLYRKSDESFYWQELPTGLQAGERKLNFLKSRDILNFDARDRLAALTVPKAGFGYYVPPLGGGEEAIVNIVPIVLPKKIFVATTPYNARKAISELDGVEGRRYDWTIKGGEFWSFHDPRDHCTRTIVEMDTVEELDVAELAFTDDLDQHNNFSYLLRKTLLHQVQGDLFWRKEEKLLHFRAEAENTPRTFYYMSSKNKAEADVVSVNWSKKEQGKVGFVRHHAFIPRFECLGNEWFLVINPTYFFTTNGFLPHSYPGALLAGKKRLDNAASVRGQVIMWHRYLTEGQNGATGLFSQDTSIERLLKFGDLPVVALETKVPDDLWGASKVVEDAPDMSGSQASLLL